MLEPQRYLGQTEVVTVSSKNVNAATPVEADETTRLRRPWFAYGAFLVLAPLCASDIFQNLGMLFWRDASDTLSPALENVCGLFIVAGGIALLYGAIDRFVVSRGIPVRPRSRFWKATVWMFLLAIGVNFLTFMTVAIGSVRRTAEELPEQPVPLTEATPAGGGSPLPPGGNAQAGDWCLLGEKPFGLWRPPGWNRGDANLLGCDAVIHELNDRAVVSVTANLLVDLPKPMRDPAHVVAKWQDLLKAQSIDQEGLPDIPCVLLGQSTHLHQIDATINGDQGPLQMRYGKAAVLHGKYLCEVTLIGKPSFLENLGDEGVQQMVSWYAPKAPE